MGIAVAPADGQRVYALIEAKEKGGLYRSDDGGEKWEWVGKERALQQRPWYFSTIHVDPLNKDVVWCPTVRLLKSIDGGHSWKQVKGPHHGDHHDLWIDPKNPRRLIASNDGGVDISLNGGATWFAPLLPLSQFYHVSADNRTPYHVMGNLQDIGTAAGPSNSLSSEGIAQRHWYNVGGGETGMAIADPKDPDTVYAGEYGGYLSRFDLRTKQAHNISPFPYNPSGKGAAEVKYRFNWTAPTLVSQHEPKTIYHGANVLFRSHNRGDSWEIVSPDLTRNDKTKQQFSGGPITGDNVGTEYYGTLFGLAESPRKPGLLWAGSDDGLVHVSTDAGKNWINVTSNIPDLPAWTTISCIEPNPFAEQTAYVVADGHRLDDARPHCWKTTDLGKTWQKISGKLPQDVYLHVLRADPKAKGVLYLGTELGVQLSLDDGLTWEPLKLNLPPVAVHDLVVKDDDLVVGTHGRSVWIFDDLTPVRRLTTFRQQREKVQLFPVQPALRWRYHSPVHSTGDKTAHDNPPEGALLHYHLPKEVKADLKLEILDREGKVIRTLSHVYIENPPAHAADPDPKDESPVLSRKAGLHRVIWDLRHQGAQRLAEAKLDAGNPLQGPLVLPGLYRARLHWGVQESAETTIEVRQDPRVLVKENELAESLQLALQMRADINRVVEMVEGIRLVRGQLERRNDLVKKKPTAAQLVKHSELLLQKLQHLEEQLHNPRAKVVYEILAQRGGARLYSQLTPLYSSVLESDGPPGQGLRKLYQEQAAELQRLAQHWRDLLQRDLVELNERTRKLDLPTVLGP